MSYKTKIETGFEALRGDMMNLDRAELVQFELESFREKMAEHCKKNGVENPYDKLDPRLVYITEAFKGNDKFINEMNRIGYKMVADLEHVTEGDLKQRLGYRHRDILRIQRVLDIFGIGMRN